MSCGRRSSAYSLFQVQMVRKDRDRAMSPFVAFCIPSRVIGDRIDKADALGWVMVAQK